MASVPLTANTSGSSTSVLYTALPAIFRTRVPTIPSLRRSLTPSRDRPVPSHFRSASVDDITENVPLHTPPPFYTSHPVSSATTRSSSPAGRDRSATEEEDQSPSRPSDSDSIVPPVRRGEAESGVNWKHANQGLSLLTLSFEESSAGSQGASHSLPPLSRQLYIHALIYLIRGLPNDLTDDETVSIRAAMSTMFPDIIIIEQQGEQHAIEVSSHRPMTNGRPERPSILHRTLAAIIVELFIFAQFLLPYIKLFLHHVFQYERKYQISRKVIKTSMGAVDEVSKKGVEVTKAIYRMNDGKVGEAINDAVIWWVTGVTGGISQGINDGVEMLGFQDTNMNRRSVKAGWRTSMSG